MKPKKPFLSVLIIIGFAANLMGQDLATWKAQSEQGNCRAQYNLGLAYYDGLAGVTKDLTEAARYLRLAADQGFAPAAANLGLMYFKGEGLPLDHAEALRYFRIGAEGGDATAQLCLATMYATGNQVAKDSSESAKWLKLSAAQGNATAQFNLGNAYAAGDGLERNFPEAGAWWFKSALQGHRKAQANLGNVAFWKKAPVGDPGVLCWLGFSLLLSGDSKGGLAAIQKSAEAGYVHAQANIGQALYTGRLLGLKLPKDLKESARWLGLAAAQGDAESQYSLGMAYLDGEGVEQNTSLALEWFLKSASQGYIDAYFNLGVLFNESASKIDQQYRDETLIKAYMFFALAAAKDPTDEGSAQAEAAKAKVSAKMTPELVAEALRQVERYGK